MKQPALNFVIPLYNEEEVFNTLIFRLNAIMESSSENIQIILVDDGSKDKTAELIMNLAATDSRYLGLTLSRNFGHQIAVTAGLHHVTASEAIMVLDGDLQDPPELYSTFLESVRSGYDVVYGIRKKRVATWWKRIAYKAFYRFQARLTNINIPLDTGDFCMMSRKAVDILNKMPEESRYIRGMRSWIGFQQKGIEYNRPERSAGETKYSIKKLFQLAFNGIFNFSESPIRLMTWIGLASTSFALLYMIWIIFEKLYLGTSPKGFPATIALISLFGGVQILGLGLLGEYVLRIFFQSKGRPLYVIKAFVKKKS